MGIYRTGVYRARREFKFEFYFSQWWSILRRDESRQPWEKMIR